MGEGHLVGDVESFMFGLLLLTLLLWFHPFFPSRWQPNRRVESDMTEVLLTISCVLEGVSINGQGPSAQGREVAPVVVIVQRYASE